MLITVITINYNNCLGLNKTIKSVCNQTFQDFEYIIIDGNSHDGSKDSIRKLQEKATSLKFKSLICISEPDHGIYDAMNKGINLSKGDYIIFMNSGDCLSSPNVLKKVFENKKYQADIIIGRQKYIRNGKISICRRTYANEVNERFLRSNTLPHQATFIKRELMQRIGGYHLDFKIVSDWIFWYEAIVNYHATIQDTNVFIANMEEEKTSSNIEKCREEMALFLKKQYPNPSLDFWETIINDNSESYLYRRASKSNIGKFLVKLALRLNKQ